MVELPDTIKMGLEDLTDKFLHSTEISDVLLLRTLLLERIKCLRTMGYEVSKKYEKQVIQYLDFLEPQIKALIPTWKRNPEVFSQYTYQEGD